MQSRAIRRLARNLRSTHRKTKSWFDTAKQHNIITATGEPNKGLAYQIAVNEFEPTEHETLLRIGMPCPCDVCKKEKRRVKREAHQDLFDMTDKAIIEALNNRRTFEPVYNKSMLAAFIKACKRKGTLQRVRVKA